MEVIPIAWSHALPPINKRGTFKAEHWVTLRFHVWRGKMLRAFVTVHPTTDPKTRHLVLERLTRSKAEFGFSPTTKGKLSEKWTKIMNEDVCNLPDEEEPDMEPVLVQLNQYLSSFQPRLNAVAKALSELKLK